MNRLAPREQLPHLRSEDAEVRATIGRSFWSRVSDQDVQYASAERAVLVLLAPDPRRRVHQRRERSVGTADRPHSRKRVWIDGRVLTDEPNGGRDVTRFLNGRLEPRAGGVGFGIVVSPQIAVLEIDRLREVGG